MERDYLISGFALLTAIINILATLSTFKSVEKLKKSLDIKGIKLQRLWEMKEKLSKFNISKDLNSIKSSDAANVSEMLNTYVNEHKEVFVNMTNIYIINKSFFDKSDIEAALKKVRQFQTIEDQITKKILQVKQDNSDMNIINSIIKLKSKLISVSIDGSKCINLSVEKEIEKLEKELL